MKKLMLLLVLVISSLCLAQYEATTNTNERSIGFGGQLGYFNPVDADNGSIMPGILMRAKFTDQIGAEVALNYRKEEYGNGAVSVTSWPVTVSLLFYPINNFYGLAGVGYYSTTFDYSEFVSSVIIKEETKSEFGIHFGAGLEFPISTGFNIFGDIRYTVLGYDFQQINQLNLQSEANANYFAITAGVLIMF